MKVDESPETVRRRRDARCNQTATRMSGQHRHQRSMEVESNGKHPLVKGTDRL